LKGEICESLNPNFPRVELLDASKVAIFKPLDAI
jgi:hypothetical protein